jgi:hypothetical protein
MSRSTVEALTPAIQALTERKDVQTSDRIFSILLGVARANYKLFEQNLPFLLQQVHAAAFDSAVSKPSDGFCC